MNTGNTGHLDPKAILANVKKHCLMGIKGTVRRNQNGHFIHANIEPGHHHYGRGTYSVVFVGVMYRSLRDLIFVKSLYNSSTRKVCKCLMLAKH